MDDHVSILDTTVIQQYVAGYPISLSDNQQRAADVNLDGSIDLSDATIIQKFSIGLIDSLPYVSP
ncbi:MAG: dockerin type I repeat-containing protein [Ruminococcus sp.]|nr:dockerin type I repeat-containing protein [Ruminococcus sp.]